MEVGRRETPARPSPLRRGFETFLCTAAEKCCDCNTNRGLFASVGSDGRRSSPWTEGWKVVGTSSAASQTMNWLEQLRRDRLHQSHEHIGRTASEHRALRRMMDANVLFGAAAFSDERESIGSLGSAAALSFDVPCINRMHLGLL